MSQRSEKVLPLKQIDLNFKLGVEPTRCSGYNGSMKQQPHREGIPCFPQGPHIERRIIYVKYCYSLRNNREHIAAQVCSQTPPNTRIKNGSPMWLHGTAVRLSA